MTLNKEDMKALTDKYAKNVWENDTVEQEFICRIRCKKEVLEI